MEIRINGKNLNGVSGLNDIQLTFPTVINGQGTFAFSSELVLQDESYEYILQKLIDGDNTCFERIEASLTDDCCDYPVLDGIIKPELIEWCDNECSVKATVTNDDSESEAWRCLRSTFIFEDGYTFSDGLKFPHRS